MAGIRMASLEGKKIDYFKGAAALGAMLLLGGCQHFTPIKELAHQSDKFMDKEVHIRGRVISSFTLPIAVQKSFYVVSDGTGQIGVVTKEAAPATNSEVNVGGQLEKIPAIALPAIQRFQIAPVMLNEMERKVSSPD